MYSLCRSCGTAGDAASNQPCILTAHLRYFETLYNASVFYQRLTILRSVVRCYLAARRHSTPILRCGCGDMTVLRMGLWVGLHSIVWDENVVASIMARTHCLSQRQHDMVFCTSISHFVRALRKCTSQTYMHTCADAHSEKWRCMWHMENVLSYAFAFSLYSQFHFHLQCLSNVDVHVHVQLHVTVACTHTRTRTNVHIQVRINRHVHEHRRRRCRTRASTRARTRAPAHIQHSLHFYLQVQLHFCLHLRLRMRRHIYMHIYMHMYIVHRHKHKNRLRHGCGRKLWYAALQLLQTRMHLYFGTCRVFLVRVSSCAQRFARMSRRRSLFAFQWGTGTRITCKYRCKVCRLRFHLMVDRGARSRPFWRALNLQG